MTTSNGSSGPANRLPSTSGAGTIPVTSSSLPPAPASNDLIAQAELVRESLRTTLLNVTTLISMARQRRQSRLMKTTLASLKQLQQLEA